MSDYYRRALRQMDLDRSEKIRDAEYRARSFYHAHPELDHLESDIARVTREGFALIRQKADSDTVMQQMQEKIAQLRSAHDAAIRAAGADPADFLPKWDCPACEDTGYIKDEQGNRTVCTCLRRRAAELSLINEEYRPNPALCFAHFDLAYYPKNPDPVPNEKLSQHDLMCRVKDVTLDYAQTFAPKSSVNFCLFGQSGLGKTYLAHCIANAVQDRGFTVCFLSAYRLSSLMREAYLGQDEALNMEQTLLSCDLLVIDDLGSEPLRRNINLESMFSLFNERMIQKKPILIATNLGMGELRDRYGERITSRLLGENAKRIRLYGQDVRLIKH